MVVTIDNSTCGAFPASTPATADNWWVVKCGSPLSGSTVTLALPAGKAEYINIAYVKVYIDTPAANKV